MRSVTYVDNIINHYNNNKTELKKYLINNLESFINIDYTNKRFFFEIIVKHTDLEIIKFVISLINTPNIKEQAFEQLVALLYKYNKYESANILLFENNICIEKILMNMIHYNVNDDIIKGFFEIYSDVIANLENDNETREWIMTYLGRSYNINLITYFNSKMELSDYDIEIIILNMITKNYTITFNNIRYMFENFYKDYNFHFIFSLIKELYYNEYFEIIDYVFEKIIFKIDTDNAVSFENFYLQLSQLDIGGQQPFIVKLYEIFNEHYTDNDWDRLSLIINIDDFYKERKLRMQLAELAN